MQRRGRLREVIGELIDCRGIREASVGMIKLKQSKAQRPKIVVDGCQVGSPLLLDAELPQTGTSQQGHEKNSPQQKPCKPALAVPFFQISGTFSKTFLWFFPSHWITPYNSCLAGRMIISFTSTSAGWATA